MKIISYSVVMALQQIILFTHQSLDDLNDLIVQVLNNVLLKKVIVSFSYNLLVLKV